MKVFSSGLVIWKDGRMIELLRVYVGECAGSRSVGRPQMRCIDTVKECKKKRFGCQASKEEGAG